MAFNDAPAIAPAAIASAAIAPTIAPAAIAPAIAPAAIASAVNSQSVAERNASLMVQANVVRVQADEDADANVIAQVKASAQTVASATQVSGSKVSVQARSTVTKTYLVRFYDAYGNIVKVQEVLRGKNAKAPAKASMAMKGRTFKKWDTAYKKVKSNLYVHPVYKDKKAVYVLAVDTSYLPRIGSVSDASKVIRWTRWGAGSTIVVGDARYGVAGNDDVIGWNTKPDGKGRYFAYGDSFKMPKRDLVLYPVYVYDAKSPHYTVTFVSNRDGVPSYERGGVFAGANVQVESELQQSGGSTLVGYTTKKNGKGTFYSLGANFTMPKKDLKLYGVWKKNTVRVQVQPNYTGNEAKPVSYFVPKGSVLPISVFASLTRDSKSATWSYKLKSFSTKKHNKGYKYPVYGLGYLRDTAYLSVGSSDVVLYANWKKANKKLTISPNGGIASNPDSYYDAYAGKTIASTNYVKRYNLKGDLLELPSDSEFQREGYVLAGYSDAKDGKALYYPRQRFVLDKSMKLYAVWSKVASQNITFVFDPGYTGKSQQTVTQSLVPGSESTVPYLPSGWEREGNCFSGWTTELDGQVAQYVPGDTWLVPSKTMKLYAVWLPTTVVTFDYNFRETASDESSASYSDNYVSGVTYLTRYVPYRSSEYAFTGWNTRADGTGDNYSVDDLIDLESSETKTLYAQWVKKDLTLTLNANFKDKGAVQANTHSMLLASGVSVAGNYGGDYYRGYSFVSYAASAYFMPDFTRDNYVFAGWNTKKDGSGKMYSSSLQLGKMTLYSNKTLYARWLKLPKVTYRQGASDVKEFGLIETGSDKGFTKKGRALVGWNTAEDGTGRNFVAGEVVNTMFGKGITLYPQFKKTSKSSSITFISNGTMLKTVKAVGKAFNVIPALAKIKDPVQVGYYFKGWNTRKNGTGSSYLDIAYTDTSVDENGVRSGTYGYTYGSLWVPKKGVKLYAQWEKASTLTLDLNYEGAATKTIEKRSDEERYVYPGEELDIPVREGYVLDGWSAFKDAKAAIYPTYYLWEQTGTPSDLTLYAIWIKA